MMVLKCMRCNDVISESYYQQGELIEKFQKQEVIKVVFGIHPDAISANYRIAPLIQEKFYFCLDCGKEIFGKMAEAIALSVLDSFNLSHVNPRVFCAKIHEVLLGKPDMPEYQKEKGHWITYWEKKEGVDGRYFNIQIPCQLFLRVIERLKDDFFNGDFLSYELK